MSGRSLDNLGGIVELVRPKELKLYPLNSVESVEDCQSHVHVCILDGLFWWQFVSEFFYVGFLVDIIFKDNFDDANIAYCVLLFIRV